MESLNNQFPIRSINPAPGLASAPPHTMMMMQNQMGLGPMRPPLPGGPNEQEEKKNEFKRGIFVSGF